MRLVTDQRQVIERVFNAWQFFPHLRLGQFIENALCEGGKTTVFYTPDDKLVEACETYVRAHPELVEVLYK